MRASSETSTPSASSTAIAYARECPIAVSPLMRSVRGVTSSMARPSASFSTPRCMNQRRAFIRRIVSPTTENRKCPGSISPAWIGPTGIS